MVKLCIAHMLYVWYFYRFFFRWYEAFAKSERENRVKAEGEKAQWNIMFVMMCSLSFYPISK